MDLEKYMGILEKVQGVFGDAWPWLVALVILLVGWIVAKFIAGIIRKALSRTNLDDRIAGAVGGDSTGCEKAIATFAFWFMMLFVIMIALNTAKLNEAVEPIKDVFSGIISFLPKLLAAVVIGFIGWLIATVVRNLLQGILGATRVDEHLGFTTSKPVSNSVGLIAFFGIILLMLPAAMDVLQLSTISEPINDLVRQIFAYAPKVLGGVLLFAIGYLVASIVQRVLSGVLSSIGADSLPARLGYRGADIGGRSLSTIISYIAMASILVIIGAQALQAMDLPLISSMAAEDVVPGYFNILVAVVIVGVGIFVANLVGQLLENRSSFWARIVKIAIIVFMSGVALQRANISNITNDTFQLVITCVIIAATFAAGVGGAIAIGLGGRDKARSWLERIR